MLINNLANLNRSTRGAVFAALIIIAAIAMYNWIVAPHVSYLFAAQEYKSAASKIVEKNKVLAREIDTKTKKLEELSEQFAQARSALFTPDEAKEFFRGLQAITKETGCIVYLLNMAVSKASFGNKQSEDNSEIAANNVTLSVTGQYNSIVGLAEKLRTYPKKIWIDSFKMEPVKLGSSELKCNMTITIYTIQDKKD